MKNVKYTEITNKPNDTLPVRVLLYEAFFDPLSVQGYTRNERKTSTITR